MDEEPPCHSAPQRRHCPATVIQSSSKTADISCPEPESYTASFHGQRPIPKTGCMCTGYGTLCSFQGPNHAPPETTHQPKHATIGDDAPKLRGVLGLAFRPEPLGTVVAPTSVTTTLPGCLRDVNFSPSPARSPRPPQAGTVPAHGLPATCPAGRSPTLGGRLLRPGGVRRPDQ